MERKIGGPLQFSINFLQRSICWVFLPKKMERSEEKEKGGWSWGSPIFMSTHQTKAALSCLYCETISFLYFKTTLSLVYVCDIVFPISQLGNCLTRCLLSSLAPGNRQELHKVTMLFTQLLLNAGSLKVKHQYILISYSQSNNLREI